MDTTSKTTYHSKVPNGLFAADLDAQPRGVAAFFYREDKMRLYHPTPSSVMRIIAVGRKLENVGKVRRVESFDPFYSIDLFMK